MYERYASNSSGKGHWVSDSWIKWNSLSDFNQSAEPATYSSVYEFNSNSWGYWGCAVGAWKWSGEQEYRFAIVGISLGALWITTTIQSAILAIVG